MAMSSFSAGNDTGAAVLSTWKRGIDNVPSAFEADCSGNIPKQRMTMPVQENREAP